MKWKLLVDHLVEKGRDVLTERILLHFGYFACIPSISFTFLGASFPIPSCTSSSMKTSSSISICGSCFLSSGFSYKFLTWDVIGLHLFLRSAVSSKRLLGFLLPYTTSLCLNFTNLFFCCFPDSLYRASFSLLLHLLYSILASLHSLLNQAFTGKLFDVVLFLLGFLILHLSSVV